METDKFGINIEAENVEILADAILKLYKDVNMRKNMGGMARKVAEEEFDRPISYKKIVDLMEKLMS